MSRISKTPIRILVFNPLKRLIAIFQSSNAAASALNIKVQSIHYACTGKTISCGNYYVRHLSDDIEVTIDDLGVLTVQEYDQLCGVERKVYPTKNITRKGLRYTTNYITSNNNEKQSD